MATFAPLKTEHHLAMDALLQEAQSQSGGDPAWAITYLMAAAIYLQQQIGMPKKEFLKGAKLQWDDINEFLQTQIIL